MSDRGGCIVCGVVMGGEADPLRCHDCVENKYMEQTGTLATFIRMTDSGPVAIEAAPAPIEWATGGGETTVSDIERLRDLLMDLGNMPDEWELNAAGLAGRLIQAGVRLPAAPPPLDEQADVAALRALAQKALDAHRLDIQREVEESGRRDGPAGVGCWCHGLAALLDEGHETTREDDRLWSQSFARISRRPTNVSPPYRIVPTWPRLSASEHWPKPSETKERRRER